MTKTPSMVERLGALTDEKRELLQLLLERSSSQSLEIKVVPRPVGGATVCMASSLAQRRLWFVDRLEGGTTAYNIPVAVRLRGALAPHVLQKALDSIAERHETLRTAFLEVDGEPLQQIAPEGRIPLELIDLRGYDDLARNEHVRLLKSQEVNEKFDLQRGPLIRGRLLRLCDDEHVLLLTIHHIVADGWSVEVLFRELAQLYAAYKEGRVSPLEALHVQYSDYALWQRELLRGDALERQVGYWRAHLSGAPPYIELPTDRKRPATRSFRGENVAINLDAARCARIRAVAQQCKMTPFMVLFAAWAVLLSRLSGQDDLAIGTPIANRQRPELENLIGLFVNTLVLRVGVRADVRVLEFLEHVKQVTLAAYAHQDAPFERVVDALQPRRSLSRNPLFQVMFVLHNAQQSGLQLPGLIVRTEEGVDEPCKFDMGLYLEERGEVIAGTLSYAADLFDRETVQRWSEFFTMLLGGVLDGLERPVSELPHTAQRDWRPVIDSFNASETPYPQHELIQEVLEEQAKCIPDTMAVVCEGRYLTYAELNRRANRLAWRLIGSGVRPERSVAICLERSLEMVVALFAVLKAGGAYVPLDPAHPSERLVRMLQDCDAVVLLARTVTRERLNIPEDVKLVTMDVASEAPTDEAEEARAHDMSPTQIGASPLQLAYVIYTSGSTGMPKGVMVSHANVLNFIRGLEERIHGLPPHCQRIAWNSSFGFDMAAKAWGQLLMGRTVHLIPEAVRLNAEMLLDFLEDHRIEAMECTPSHLRMLLAGGFLQGRARTLRKLLLGGEPIDPRTWKMLAAVQETAFFNMYGPTECSVDATCEKVSGETPNIGRVMPNARIYVLDEQRQLVGVGMTGEIYIGGAGVARGYLNRPALTAERFSFDPFGIDSTARIYRTGDIGRWRESGTIEYVGRNDDQVKIRGFRIELGEIEARLAEHDHVREAAVMVREDVPSEKRLVAYLTRRGRCERLIDELRDHLVAVLPEYMIPSAIVILESMPLSRNGKVDRLALPAPEASSFARRKYESPHGEVEQLLANIWGELLGAERVGRHDNFFELGGHSLLATRVIARVRVQFQIELPLRSLFDAPTVEQLAVLITAERETLAALEERRAIHLAHDFRIKIEGMRDDAVCARIAELEKELDPTKGGGQSG